MLTRADSVMAGEPAQVKDSLFRGGLYLKED